MLPESNGVLYGYVKITPIGVYPGINPICAYAKISMTRLVDKFDTRDP